MELNVLNVYWPPLSPIARDTRTHDTGERSDKECLEGGGEGGGGGGGKEPDHFAGRSLKTKKVQSYHRKGQ